ncbi:hypothetical protein [Nocardia sp. NPDC059236]|uniref:hypothetical protein n=1 Tax=Nocardia sp. NPDC059236 TaxID=3346783 RepID=UPI003675D994
MVALFGRDAPARHGIGSSLLGAGAVHDGPGFAGRRHLPLWTGRLSRIRLARISLWITGNRPLLSGGWALRPARAGAGSAAFPRRRWCAPRWRPVGSLWSAG